MKPRPTHVTDWVFLTGRKKICCKQYMTDIHSNGAPIHSALNITLPISLSYHSGSLFQHYKPQIGEPLLDESNPAGKRKEKEGIMQVIEIVFLNLWNEK
jgi:hypothetical protein